MIPIIVDDAVQFDGGSEQRPNLIFSTMGTYFKLILDLIVSE